VKILVGDKKSKKKKVRRQDSQKLKRVENKWRSPKGSQSKQRKEKKGSPAIPKVGRRKPAEQRNIHPSGYREVLVHNPEEIEKVGEDEAVRIAGKVGKRKRSKIQEKARKEGIKILNPKNLGSKSD